MNRSQRRAAKAEILGQPTHAHAVRSRSAPGTPTPPPDIDHFRVEHEDWCPVLQRIHAGTN